MKHSSIFILFITLISISCKKEDSLQKLESPLVKIDQKILNFGKIKVGDTIKHTFSIKNISDRKFIIDTVGTTCGCTTIKFTPDSVSRNQTAKIDVQYIAQEPGKISKSVVVSGNTKSGFLTFYLRGTVVGK